ncbi:major facilitator superfamily (MFS) transporter [Legionella adelaidensis]|uniref:Lysosomal dipeptide transporter MFSD1 n=1 Tax=Legionella adelaidensis TaxID=45056 RepID=A0A0W0R0Z4_9GAMM|nr:MFS transporter [Legionella adelaidensis]KTC64738.1 major facilitator superfamily (MFS) transporter [Legionella adelaidensis]
MSSSTRQNTVSTAFPQSILPWIVWGLGCIFYFYEFLLQVSPSVMGNELMRDFSITSQTLGFLSGIYYYSYSPMQLPCGVLMDRFGPHRILTIATAICAISTLAFGLTDNLFMAAAARLMIGFGSAFAAVGTMKLASNWFPPERFPLLTGLMVTIGMLGAISGETPLALLVDYYGWRHTMSIMGVVGLVLAVLIFVVAKDYPDSSGVKKHEDNSDQAPMLTSLVAIFKNTQLWLVAIYGGLMYMATPVFCGLWGVPFLMYKMAIAKTVAAHYISLVLIGWAIASPLWGIYSNRIGKRKPPMYIGTVGSLITCLLFIYAPIESGLVMQALLFLFGIFSAGFLCAFAVAKELCNRHYVATGLGFMNMINMVGVAICQPFIGYVLDQYWAGDLVNNVRVYPIKAYHVGLSILPIGIFISLLILFKVKETYCHWVGDEELEAHGVKA